MLNKLKRLILAKTSLRPEKNSRGLFTKHSHINTRKYMTYQTFFMLFKAEDALIHRERATIDENTSLLLPNRSKIGLSLGVTHDHLMQSLQRK